MIEWDQASLVVGKLLAIQLRLSVFIIALAIMSQNFQFLVSVQSLYRLLFFRYLSNQVYSGQKNKSLNAYQFLIRPSVRE